MGPLGPVGCDPSRLMSHALAPSPGAWCNPRIPFLPWSLRGSPGLQVPPWAACSHQTCFPRREPGSAPMMVCCIGHQLCAPWPSARRASPPARREMTLRPAAPFCRNPGPPVTPRSTVHRCCCFTLLPCMALRGTGRPPHPAWEWLWPVISCPSHLSSVGCHDNTGPLLHPWSGPEVIRTPLREHKSPPPTGPCRCDVCR